MLADFKRRGRGTALHCKECTARLAALNKKLRDKKAWRCTCKQGAHDFSNEKCTLYPQRAGEKRWPGKNLEITEEDLAFRERLSKRRKQ